MLDFVDLVKKKTKSQLSEDEKNQDLTIRLSELDDVILQLMLTISTLQGGEKNV
jgi:hypothetical protein